MSLITCQNLSVSFAARSVFRDATFSVEKGDKIGLIGANGCGKTTLLNLLTGALEPDEGKIFIAAGTRIGCVEQHACRGSERTVYEEMLTVFSHLQEMERELEELHRKIALTDGNVPEYIERQSALSEAYQAGGGLTYAARAHSALAGLGFTKAEETLPVSALSGGQRTKLSLGKLLLSEPDCMLLDEPTNHLDIESVEWLEDFLGKFTGSLLVISHDRYFLDQVTSRTLEISGKRLYAGKGSYSVYVKTKAQRLESDRREYEKGMLEIKRIEKMIEQQKRFNQERNYITIASKEKQIERIRETLPALPPKEAELRLRFGEVKRAGDEVLYAEGLEKSYDGKLLFRDVSFQIFRGDKVFLLGPNGCGKSTMLGVLMHRIAPDGGFCRFGHNVFPGFFEQTQGALMTEKTVLQEIYDAFPLLTIPEIRAKLGAFCFRGDEIEKRMCDLSGGERARVALLEMILKNPNFLVLDEPTNHLDAASREVLEEALEHYEGTLLCVSHDRYFVNRLATRLMCFQGSAVSFTEGNYDTYVQQQKALKTEAEQKPEKKPSDYARKKEDQKNARKRTARLGAIERRLAALTEEKDAITADLQTPEVAADYEKILAHSDRLNEIKAEEDALEEEWLTLTDNE